jgi:hypothetical protein
MDNKQGIDYGIIGVILFAILVLGIFIYCFYVLGTATNALNDTVIIQENKTHISEYIPEAVNYKIIIGEEDYWIENYAINNGLITIERYWDNTGSLLDLENYFKYYTSPTIISSNFTIILLN